MASLINMEMSKEEAKEQTQPTPADAPRYPWGLEISLDDDSLEKLGLDKLPEAGTEVTIVAKATVSRVSEYQTQGKEMERSMGLQITDMQLSTAGTDILDALYPKK